MAKANEIAYIQEVSRVDGVPLSAFESYLLNKPFSDPRCHEYLMDAAQIMSFLPPSPARILDVGVGSGWTSELFARAGHKVTGIDISEDMIAIARRRQCGVDFRVADYESSAVSGTFDAAVIYDALHHADDPYAVIKNIFDALAPGGVLVTIEPGQGHSTSPDSLKAVEKYGTTENDMPYSLQKRLMAQAGFGSIGQFPRASAYRHSRFARLLEPLRLRRGATSVVVARR